VNEALPEKRQKTEHGNESTQLSATAPSFDISAMLQTALGNLDEQQLGRSSPVDGEARSLPRPAVSPITPPGANQRTLQNQVKFASNPLRMMRSMSLPMLGNTAVQILLALSQQPREETTKLLADRDSAYRKSFDLLATAFDAVKKLFSEDRQIISADDLEIRELEDRESIRMANLATTCIAIFGEAEVAMDDIHEDALRIFMAEDGEVTEELARLLLDLKTRTFVMQARSPEGLAKKEDLLDKYFPPDFKETLKRRNLFGGPLTPVEEGLLRSMKMRRGELTESFQNPASFGK
jgi:protein TBF1